MTLFPCLLLNTTITLLRKKPNQISDKRYILKIFAHTYFA